MQRKSYYYGCNHSSLTCGVAKPQSIPCLTCNSFGAEVQIAPSRPISAQAAREQCHSSGKRGTKEDSVRISNELGGLSTVFSSCARSTVSIDAFTSTKV
jgi:hypothetical protein